jgi:hypothetical protein
MYESGELATVLGVEAAETPPAAAPAADAAPLQIENRLG